MLALVTLLSAHGIPHGSHESHSLTELHDKVGKKFHRNLHNALSSSVESASNHLNEPCNIPKLTHQLERKERELAEKDAEIARLERLAGLSDDESHVMVFERDSSASYVDYKTARTVMQVTKSLLTAFDDWVLNQGKCKYDKVGERYPECFLTGELEAPTPKNVKYIEMSQEIIFKLITIITSSDSGSFRDPYNSGYMYKIKCLAAGIDPSSESCKQDDYEYTEMDMVTQPWAWIDLAMEAIEVLGIPDLNMALNVMLDMYRQIESMVKSVKAGKGKFELAAEGTEMGFNVLLTSMCIAMDKITHEKTVQTLDAVSLAVDALKRIISGAISSAKAKRPNDVLLAIKAEVNSLIDDDGNIAATFEGCDKFLNYDVMKVNAVTDVVCKKDEEVTFLVDC